MRRLILYCLFAFLICPCPAFQRSASAAPDTRVGKIIFTGNEALSSAKLTAKMKMKQGSLIRLRSSSRFDETILQQDIGLMEALYHKNGFLECVITKQVDMNDKAEADIHIFIQEGQQTLITDITISHLEAIQADVLLKELAKSLQLAPDGPLDMNKLSRSELYIQDRLADCGHPLASVKSQISRQEERAIVQFQVVEGPLVYIGDLSFRGNIRTRPHVLERELLFRKGDVFNRSRVLDSQQRMYSTGLYAYVNIEPVVTSDSSVVAMNVTVVERKRRWTGIRGGIGQQEQLDLTCDAAGEWGHRNIMGTGRRVSVKADVSMNVRTMSLLSNGYEVSYTEPWVFVTRTPLTIDVYLRRFTWELYDLREFGTDLNISHEFSRKVKARVTFVYRRADVSDMPAELEPDILGQAGVKILRRMSFGIERDARDHPLYPSQGTFSQLLFEYTGGLLGGSEDYYKFVGMWSRYQSWFPKTVIAARVKAGGVKEFGQSRYIPIYDRFFAGGANTVRGYVERTLGPLESSEPIGGALLFLSNLEMRRQLFWRLGLSVFLDAGNVWKRIDDFRWQDIRFSTGAGLQFFTPIGPFRVEYGQRLSKEVGLKEGVLHISLMYAF